ncbi:MAG: sulfotransferase family protein [Paracoccaceae bacterium]
MSLQIIGSGFGRTGTMSTKIALEALGFGPCHHMTEVMENPDQPAYWKALADRAKVDWAEAFAGYNAQADFPGAAVWPELSIAFPEAKILHTERPEDAWWASYSGTINKFWVHRTKLDLPPPIAEIFDTMDKIVVQDLIGGTDEATAIKAYRRNNEKVRDMISADRLLVFTPTDGWEPLCRFLEVDVPEGDFPRSHARDEFWAHFGGEPTVA